MAHPFSSELKTAGYYTCIVGKMRFNPPRAHYGFDHMYLSEEIPAHIGDDEYLQFLRSHGVTDVLEPHGRHSASYYVPQVSPLPESLRASSWVAAQSAEMLARNRNRPFLLVSSFIKPHPPFEPCQSYLDALENVTFPPRITENPLDGPDDRIPVQNGYKVGGLERLSEAEIARIRRHSFACVAQTDAASERFWMPWSIRG